MRKKAELMEGKLITIIIISVFLVVMIGVYLIAKEKYNANLMSIFKFF